MEAVFVRILNMSITASYVILAVLALRILLKKAPKRFSYLLWSVVGFRLCCPVSFTSVFSLFSVKLFDMTHAQSSGSAALRYIPDTIGTMAQPTVTTGIPLANSLINPTLPAAVPEYSVSPMQVWLAVFAVIWCAGMAALLLYGIVSYIRLRQRMASAVKLEGNVYESDRVSSPFVLGFARPKIYIPFGLDGETRRYVLAHERHHLRRLDHIVKPFAFLLLALHWFNPLCWLAFTLMSRDMEMSCDERVLTGEQSVSKSYSLTLLSFATGRRFPAPSPLAFNETDVKRRIKNALRFKKPAAWMSLVAAILCLAAITAFAANPESGQDIQPEQTPSNNAFVDTHQVNKMRQVINAQAAWQILNDQSKWNRVYVSSRCTYMNPLSSFYPVDGDSGCRYIIDDADFFVLDKQTNDVEFRASLNLDQWTEPNEAEWASLFSPSSDVPDMDAMTRMVVISDTYRLFELDGALSVAQTHKDQQGNAYIWSIYRLINDPIITIVSPNESVEAPSGSDTYYYDQYDNAIPATESVVFEIGYSVCQFTETHQSDMPILYYLTLSNRTDTPLKSLCFTAHFKHSPQVLFPTPIWHNDPMELGANGSSDLPDTVIYSWTPAIVYEDLAALGDVSLSDFYDMLIEITWEGGREIIRLDYQSVFIPESIRDAIGEHEPLSEETVFGGADAVTDITVEQD